MSEATFESILEVLPPDRRGIFRNARDQSQDLPFMGMTDLEIEVSDRLIAGGLAMEAERRRKNVYYYVLAWVK